MHNYRCLIYGANGGIGSAITKRLYEQGWTLHLAGRSQKPIQKMAQEYGAEFSVGDANDPDWFEQVATDVDGPLDALVYAIGTINLQSIKRIKSEELLHDFSVNALGAARAVQTALPALCQRASASVLLFSSVAATQGFPLHASMGLAKGAIDGLTRSLAAELAPRIRVNAIAPSLTRTRLAEPILTSAAMEQAIAKQHPLQRIGIPDDIAPMAALLLSPESAWITGQVVAIDGGRSTLQGKH